MYAILPLVNFIVPVLNYFFVSNTLFLFTTLASFLPVQPHIVSPLPIAQTPKQFASQEQNDKQTAHNAPTTNKPITSHTDNQITTQQPAPVFSTTLQPTLSPTQEEKSQTNTTQPSQTTTATATPTPSTPHTITATSTIKGSGKTIHLSMEFPSNGGTISGTMNGDCNGTISGTYAGPATSNLSGTAKATCSEGFLHIPLTITYSGKMAPSDTQATITYTVSALGE